MLKQVSVRTLVLMPAPEVCHVRRSGVRVIRISGAYPITVESPSRTCRIHGSIPVPYISHQVCSQSAVRKKEGWVACSHQESQVSFSSSQTSGRFRHRTEMAVSSLMDSHVGVVPGLWRSAGFMSARCLIYPFVQHPTSEVGRI